MFTDDTSVVSVWEMSLLDWYIGLGKKECKVRISFETFSYTVDQDVVEHELPFTLDEILEYLRDNLGTIILIGRLGDLKYYLDSKTILVGRNLEELKGYPRSKSMTAEELLKGKIPKDFELVCDSKKDTPILRLYRETQKTLNLLESSHQGLAFRSVEDNLPVVFKAGEQVKFRFSFIGERSSWSDAQIGRLFRRSEQRERYLESKMTKYVDCLTYYLCLQGIEQKVSLDKYSIGVEIKVRYELLPATDYWATIGYYLTRYEALSRDNYSEKEIRQWAKEWRVKGREKEILLSRIHKKILNLSWSDF